MCLRLFSWLCLLFLHKSMGDCLKVDMSVQLELVKCLEGSKHIPGL